MHHRALGLVRSQAHSLTQAVDLLRSDLLAIVRAALSAVDAGRLVARALETADAFTGDERVWIVAAGKAAPLMAAAAVGALEARVSGGIVVSPAPASVPPPLEAVTGGHPVPTAGSEVAGRRAIELAKQMDRRGRLLVLLSGGASSLMAVPAPGLALDDKRRTTELLLRAGADIHALNTVRKHLSAVKGGWLAAATSAPSQTLAVSDVVGDDPSVIGSGPTVGDRSTFQDALDVLGRFGGPDAFPPSVTWALTEGVRGTRPETPKPGDSRLAFARSLVIGGRHEAMRGAAAAAAARGYHPIVLEAPVVGEARQAARAHVEIVARQTALAVRPLAVISSGETTVRVTGEGRGGRNQEFALMTADRMGSLGVAAAVSVGTDGIDGPTDAAGGIVDSTSLERARRKGLPPVSAFLDDNNSHAFFDALGDLVRTGPTGTNVGDLQVFLLA